MSRYLSIWFPYLITDRAAILRPQLKATSFVVAAPERGRTIIGAASPIAIKKGITPGMAVADARAIVPELKVFQYKEGIERKLLTAQAEWCLRFTPVTAVDLPDGILLDISGCPHLWGGEQSYLADIVNKLKNLGFTVKAAIADTIGAAWAVARYGKGSGIVPPGRQLDAIKPLPPAALRIDDLIRERLQKLGFYRIGNFVAMPRTVLRRRFGQALLDRIDQALGQAIEVPEPVQPAMLFQKVLPCPEPIKTRTGIDIALNTLLEQLCRQLAGEEKGLRTAVFKSYCMDGSIQQITIGTHRPARNVAHLLKLFDQKIETIRPGLGIEQFSLEAPVVEDLSAEQESIWKISGGISGNNVLSDLMDRIAGRVGEGAISRYLPAEHYWPERSFRTASSLFEKPDTDWRGGFPRPVLLLPVPERIEVTVPIPDYPPMLFVYKGHVHKIKKADGPERIEREWWTDKGLQRDYYCAEDETGARYWLFRTGHYAGGQRPEWFIHGFFA